MKKRLITLALLAASIFQTSDTFAACGLFGRIFGGRRACCQQSCYRYAPTYPAYATTCGTCQGGTCTTTSAPEPMQFPEELQNFDEFKPETCEAPTCTNCEPSTPSCGSAPTCSLCKPLRTVAESVYLAKVNAVRFKYGRAPLSLDANLERGCENHANWMASYGVLQHASGGYGSGEIIAQNNGVGIETALTQWQNSSAHAALLLNPYFSKCGIATKRDAYGRNWCVMRFM